MTCSTSCSKLGWELLAVTRGRTLPMYTLGRRDEQQTALKMSLNAHKKADNNRS